MEKKKKNQVVTVRMSEEVYSDICKIATKKKWTVSSTMLHLCRCSLVLDAGSMVFADLDPDEKLTLSVLLGVFESKYGVDASTPFLNYGLIPDQEVKL